MLKVTKDRKTYAIKYREDSGKDMMNPEGVGPVLATFHVKPIMPKRMRELAKKYTTYEWDAPDATTPKQRFDVVDFTAITYARVNEMIVDWDDVVDDNEQPRPCDAEAKVDFFETYPHIFNYLTSMLQKYTVDMTVAKDDEAKN